MAATSEPELAHVVHDGTGPPALFVHGFLTGAAYWELNLPALSAVCQPIVIELWGHGDSPSPAQQRHYEPAGVVAAFERLRRRLGHERWFVVSHSLGSALALHYALAHPERIAGLVITNSNSALADAELNETRVAFARRQADRIEREGMAAFHGHPLNPSFSKRLPSAARTALIEAFDRHDPVGLANTLRWTTTNASVVDRIGDVAVPTLLTWGVFEKRFAPGAELARDRIAGLEVAELEGGHPVNLNDREGFDRAVASFIAANS